MYKLKEFELKLIKNFLNDNKMSVKSLSDLIGIKYEKINKLVNGNNVEFSIDEENEIKTFIEALADYKCDVISCYLDNTTIEKLNYIKKINNFSTINEVINLIIDEYFLTKYKLLEKEKSAFDELLTSLFEKSFEFQVHELNKNTAFLPIVLKVLLQ